jgi:hypothetical protein
MNLFYKEFVGYLIFFILISSYIFPFLILKLNFGILGLNFSPTFFLKKVSLLLTKVFYFNKLKIFYFFWFIINFFFICVNTESSCAPVIKKIYVSKELSVLSFYWELKLNSLDGKFVAFNDLEAYKNYFWVFSHKQMLTSLYLGPQSLNGDLLNQYINTQPYVYLDSCFKTKDILESSLPGLKGYYDNVNLLISDPKYIENSIDIRVPLQKEILQGDIKKNPFLEKILPEFKFKHK